MAEYNIRRDNLISPWGVGAIVPFPHDESLMVGGLDYWFDEEHSIDDFLVVDERLTKRLHGKLFVLPPDYRTSQQDQYNAFMKIPAVRFPLWNYCPVCGNMELIGIAGGRKRCSGEIRRKDKRKTYCSEVKQEKRPYLIPERFVTVCKKGHIEDFPIMEWVHKDGYEIKANCRLIRSTGGASSSLAGVRYTCTCGASRNMQEAFHSGALDRMGYFCRGRRPWLGINSDEECGESLTVLQRGASNVWFANIISSIYIPWIPKYTNSNTKDCIAKGVNKFKSSLTNGEIDKDTIKKFIETYSMIYDDIDQEQAYEEIIATLENNTGKSQQENEEEYRKQEYDVLTRNSGKPSDELWVKNYKQSEYKNMSFLKTVSLVHKLRETRVFVGFSRLLPEPGNTPSLSVGNVDWLPAVKNTGEGIMLEFDMDELNKWANKESVKQRVKIIENNLRASNKIDKQELNPIYVLLHTFAHCTIIALSNESGYSNASIREKIYCPQFLTEENQMAGILIYTASGDAEGSLGGLVRQGLPGKLEEIIKLAISEARWCAADPVCIQSPGQGQSGCNLAACHNCALLPETSCENQNMLLDRGLMIGTLNDREIGFFNNSLYELN